ncbi:MAG: phage holin family protein [Lentisphaeraceae bacterium]|nr:phage holin family protein [Lentisphaeraceae bacterium]
MKALANDLLEYASIIFLAAFGGLVRYLTSKPTHEKLKISIVIVEIIVAIFAGLVVSFALSSFSLDPNTQSAAVAIAGYSSRGVLYLISTRFMKRLKTGMDNDQ